MKEIDAHKSVPVMENSNVTAECGTQSARLLLTGIIMDKMRRINSYIHEIGSAVLLVICMAGVSGMYAQTNVVTSSSVPYAVNAFTGSGPGGTYSATFEEAAWLVSLIQSGTADFNDKDVDMSLLLYYDNSVNNCDVPLGNYLKVELTADVTFTTLVNGVLTTLPTEQMKLTVDKYYDLSVGKEVEMSFRAQPNSYKVVVNVTSVKATLLNGTVIPNSQIPANVFFRIDLSRNRIYKVNPSQLTTSFYGPPPGPIDWNMQCDINWQTRNEFVVSWNAVPWALEYELEWTFVDDMGAQDIAVPKAENTLPLVFKGNSSRVRVPATQTSYRIPLIYNGGWVCTRVRPVTRGGSALDLDLFGDWSFDPYNTGTLTVNDLPQFARFRMSLLNTTTWVNNLNSKYEISFAEGGKMQPKAVYADGSMRTRQENTVVTPDLNPTSKMAMISETIYDFLGRPAVLTMPAVTETGLWYKQNYNLSDASGNKYSYLDFDFGTSAAGTCYASSEGMKTSSGASNYYSPQNAVQTNQQKYLPDAAKYPFTRVIYEADNTNRPKAMGGGGFTHRIGNGHEVKNIYGNPSQEELNRLFGTDAGYAGFYQKAMTIDANGQVSVTYVDMAGRTIATALAGKSPLTLEPLKDGSMALQDGGVNVEENLLGDVTANPHGSQNLITADGDGYTVNRFLLVTSTKDYQIDYTMNEVNYENSCVPGFCADCVYDLEISLTDECGNYIIGNDQLTGPMIVTVPGSVLNGSCETNGTYAFSQTVSLTAGSYNLVKKVHVNEAAADYYVNYMMENQTCLQNLTDFYLSPDITDCFMDCTTCMDGIGTETAFVSNTDNLTEYGSADAARIAYRELLKQCESLCGFGSQEDECSLGYEMMLLDVSPLGQYGGYAAGSAASFPLSVFNENNELPARSSNQFNNVVSPQNGGAFASGTLANWRMPMYKHPVTNIWQRGYYDANGNRALALITTYPDGTVFPEVMSGATIQTIGGEQMVYVEELKYVQDFVDIFWQPSFARSLVAYHPEYFKYELCENALGVTNTQNDATGTLVELNTYSYARMLETLSYAQASANLGLSGTSICSSILIDAMINNDPYFSAANASVSFAENNLFASGPVFSVRDFVRAYANMHYTDAGSGTTYDIAEFAYLNTGMPLPAAACSTSGTTITMTDELWKHTAILYASARQQAMSLGQEIFQVARRQIIYTDCIGAAEYTLRPDPDAQMIFSRPSNPCNSEDYPLYSGLQQRFPSFTSLLEQNGYSNPPDPEQLGSYGAQAGYIATGKCPLQIDLENLLARLAYNGKLSGLPQTVNLAVNAYLGTALFNEINIAGAINASVTSTGSGIQLVLPMAAGNCTTLLANPVFPAGTGWADVYHMTDIHPVPGGWAINAYINHPQTTFVEIPFTSCLNFSGCTIIPEAICKPSQDMREIMALMNVLSKQGQLWSTTGVNLQSGPYIPFVTANLKSLLGTGGSPAYRWYYVPGTTPSFQLVNNDPGAMRKIILSPTTGLTPGTAYYFTKVSPTPSVNSTPGTTATATFHAVVNNGQNIPFYVPAGTAQFSAAVTVNTVSTLRSCYASECEEITDPRCNTQEHRNLRDLARRLHLARTEGATAAFGGLTSGIVWPSLFENGQTFSLSAIVSVDEVVALMGQGNGVSSQVAMVKVTLAGGVHTQFVMTYSKPMRNCEPCDLPVTCDAYLQYDVTLLEDIVPAMDGRLITLDTQGLCGFFGSMPNPSKVFNASTYPSFYSFLIDWASEINTTYSSVGVFAWCFVHSNGNYYLNLRRQADQLDSECGCSGYGSSLRIQGFPGSLQAQTTCCSLAVMPLSRPARVLLPEDNWQPSPEFSYSISGCNEPVAPFPTDTIDDPCVTYLLEWAAENAQNAYQAYLDSVRRALRAEYINTCMTLQETFVASYNSDEYHYTLYYYDRAGNLVRTVPPQAVLPLGSSAQASINSARVAGTEVKPRHNNGVDAEHLQSSRYRFNSMNQPILQETPDAGISQYFYDNMGRIVLTQNAVQAASAGKYSYYLYDAQGRTVEKGEMTRSTILPTRAGIHNPSSYGTFFSSYTKAQFIRTYYDAAAPASGFYPTGFFSQNNLRKRVAYVTYEPGNGFAPNSSSFQSASYYDYDFHGKVKNALMQNNDIPDYDPSNFMYNYRYSKMAYKYDLLSDVVLELAVNKGRADQFYYRYTYDDMNRMLRSESSTNGLRYDVDADYRYYRHGPLARVEYGNNNVQGMDYVYTLQGWLKAINSENLSSSKDPGLDGQSGSQYANVARDVYGTGITYYQGDYTSISGVSDFLLSVPPAYYANKNLYSGNIVAANNTVKAWNASTVEPLLQVYNYDQLNRIIESHAYKQNDAPVNITAWNPAALAGNMYRTEYAYDFAGNIKSLDRYDAANQIDNLEYIYYGNKNQLRSINETISASLVNYDLDNHTNSNNYVYDAVGNLRRDVSEQIKEINWNIYGKVISVIRNSISPQPDLFFNYDWRGDRITQSSEDENGVRHTYYLRDAGGSIVSTYTRDLSTNDIYLEDNTLFGAERLGMQKRDLKLPFTPIPATTPYELSRGQKRYELKNHLENVQVVVSDRKKTNCKQILGNYIFNYYDAEILYTYDYYPYGMLIEDRKQYRPECEVTVNTTYTTVFNDQFNAATTSWIYVDNMANPTVTGGQMRYSRPGVSLVRLFTAVPGKQYRVTFRVTPQSCITNLMVMGNLDNATTMLCNAAQAYTFTFTANDISSGVGFYSTATGKGCYVDIDYVILEEVNEEHTVLCDNDLKAYKYGYNGMRKQDETLSNLDGTSYDFGSRIYDPRIGRWLSVDPKAFLHPNWSPYKAFNDNPIIYTDPGGEDEILIIQARNKVTGEISIHVIPISNNMYIRTVEMRDEVIDGWYNVYHYYDKLRVKTLDYDPATMEYSNVQEIYSGPTGAPRLNSYFDLGRNLYLPNTPDITGKGGTQKYGIHITCKECDASMPTRFKAEIDLSNGSVDGDELLAFLEKYAPEADIETGDLPPAMELLAESIREHLSTDKTFNTDYTKAQQPVNTVKIFIIHGGGKYEEAYTPAGGNFKEGDRFVICAGGYNVIVPAGEALPKDLPENTQLPPPSGAQPAPSRSQPQIKMPFSLQK